MESKKVLLVDEEKWYIDGIIDRIISEIGVNLYDYAMTGNEALDLIEKNKNYCLIVLDMMLPAGAGEILEIDETGINPVLGLEVLKVIKEKFPNLPVVCYTALKDEQVKQQILDQKAEYLLKLDETSFDNLFEKIKNKLQN